MVELLIRQLKTDLGHCDLFQRLNTVFAPLSVTPITLLRQRLWRVAHSVYQSEIKLDHVSNQRHLCCGCNGNQIVQKPSKNTMRYRMLAILEQLLPGPVIHRPFPNGQWIFGSLFLHLSRGFGVPSLLPSHSVVSILPYLLSMPICRSQIIHKLP
jgi:hypothetical protein